MFDSLLQSNGIIFVKKLIGEKIDAKKRIIFYYFEYLISQNVF
jgi:hypothetical protein